MPTKKVRKINKDWHLANKMPKNPTLDQRVKWHIEHARHCSCRPLEGELLEVIKKRYLGTHQEFWIFFNKNDHKALASWAADCAEHVLLFFEEKYPIDHRPRQAIKTLKAWIKTGVFKMAVVRKASLDAHAAARKVKEKDNAASFAARAAGQAVATAHVPTHALGAAMYAIKAIAATKHTDAEATKAKAKERKWQLSRLPQNLQWWITKWIETKERGLKV